MHQNGRHGPRSPAWCGGGTELAALLGDTFGRENVNVCSPFHLQVRQESAIHNVWIDSSRIVKYRLADQAGRAQQAGSAEELLQAIGGHDDRTTDLVNMRAALELSALIDTAKAALPRCGVCRAVFVDAGAKGARAQIAVVEVAMEADGEYVRAESKPCPAIGSNAAEEAAIEHAVTWAAKTVLIFSDNQAAVARARRRHGDRVRWLPREQNKVADRVANVRSKRKRRRKKRKAK